MSLQLHGEVREVSRDTRTHEGRDYEVITLHVLSGKSDIDRVRIGRDFGGVIPREGENVTLNVVAGAYAGRNGVVSTLTALSRVETPAASKAA